MADDITYTSSSPAGPPNGSKQVTDEHATRGHMPVVKVGYSADGSATLAQVDADGVLVNLGTNNDVTVTGTVTVQDGGSTVSVDDGGGSLTVDGAVTVSATDLDVRNLSSATDSVAVTDGGGSLTVDGTVAVSGSVTVADGGSTISVDDGAGSLTVDGTVAATQSGTWSVTDGGGSLTVDGTVAVSSVSGSVTVADGGSSISVDDNGGSLTVDGTVSATQSGTWSVSTTSAISGIGDGRKTVATAGSREALASTTACKRLVICAETDNTGTVVVGGSTVVATLATRRGLPLGPGDVFELEIDDLADVYIDSTVSGDGVTYTYFS